MGHLYKILTKICAHGTVALSRDSQSQEKGNKSYPLSYFGKAIFAQIVQHVCGQMLRMQIIYVWRLKATC